MNHEYYIKEWSRYRGLSLYEVASMANIGQSTIYRIIRTGRLYPSSARKIASALNISVEELQELPPVGSYRKAVDIVNEHAESADVYEGIIRDIGSIDPKYLIPLLTKIPEGPWEKWFTGSILELSSEYVFRPPGVTGKNVFAFRMHEKAMEPVIYRGDALFIDPEEEISDNNGETRLIRTDVGIMIRSVYNIDVPNGPYYRIASEVYEEVIIHFRDAIVYKIAGVYHKE